MTRGALWATALLLTVATGCVTATPPKTPNQREVERRQTTNPAELPRVDREPPPAIKL
jgi:hypothetical protein